MIWADFYEPGDAQLLDQLSHHYSADITKAFFELGVTPLYLPPGLSVVLRSLLSLPLSLTLPAIYSFSFVLHFPSHFICSVLIINRLCA